MLRKFKRSLFWVVALSLCLNGCFLFDSGNGGQKSKSSDATLSKLVVTGYDLGFEKNKFSYQLNVDNHVDQIEVVASVNHNGAKIEEGLGFHPLYPGKNEIYIDITAEDGTTSITYTINVNRKVLDSNVYLASVETSISGWNIGFDKDIISYFHTVPNITKEIVIKSQVESLTSTVIGNGYYELKTGENVIELIVQAEDGISEKTYSFYINRESPPSASNNALLSSLTVKDFTLNETFQSSNTIYSLNVGTDVASIAVETDIIDSTLSVVGDGVVNLRYGLNTITIQVRSKDNIDVTNYILEVLRDYPPLPDANSKLSSLSIEGYTLDQDFNSEVNRYSLTVADDISYVTVTAVAEKETSSVNGLGLYAVNYGYNNIEVEVVAEDGINKSKYIVEIIRDLPQVDNESVKLKSLSIEGIVLNETFDSSITSYSAVVDHDIEYINILAEADNSSSSVSGIGLYSLEYGKNSFTIEVSLADDSNNSVYVLEVTREYPPLPSSNSKLSQLSIQGVSFNEIFNSEINMYTAVVTHNVTHINILATPENNTSSVFGTGSQAVRYGVNSIRVDVIAENGIDASSYIIEVTREYPPVPDSNTKLSSLIVDGYDLDKAFDADIVNYSLSVEHNVESIKVTAITEKNTSSVSGAGNVTLDYGFNRIVLRVTAEDGISNSTYILDVTRENPPVLDNNSQLSSLEIEGISFNEDFNPNKLSYTATVDKDVTGVNLLGTALKTSSQINGLGNVNLEYGLNEFIIEVTAEDGVTKSTYTVAITREQPVILDTNSNLSNIVVEGYALNEIFHSAILNYTVTVADTENKINIFGIREKDTSTIVGNGEVALDSKVTTIKIIVTAQDGVNKTEYTIVVTKMDPYVPDSNSSLSNLSVPGYIFNSAFDPAIKQYSFSVNHDVETINVNATASSEKSSITGTGSVNLNYGTNTIYITVLAENGINTSLYTLTVYRNNPPVIDDSSLLSLSVSSGLLNPAFNPAQLNYTVDLLYEQSQLTVSSEANVSTSVITGNGQYDLIVGDNRIEITVLAADNISETTYVITVNRGEYIPSDNSNLSSLSIYGIALDQDFSPSTLNYTVEVPYSTSSIDILATKEHNLATIESGTGTESLVVGDNTFTIIVKAENTVTKTYSIIVTRLEAGVTSTFNFVTPVDETITLNSTGSSFSVNDTFNVNIDEDFDSYRWFVGTVDQLNSSKSITIDCSSLEPGNHRIMAVVTKDGRAYSKFLYFTVSNN